MSIPTPGNLQTRIADHLRAQIELGQLKPGEQFQYTSGCPLGTPVGTMHGSFQMVDENGVAFDVPAALLA